MHVFHALLTWRALIPLAVAVIPFTAPARAGALPDELLDEIFNESCPFYEFAVRVDRSGKLVYWYRPVPPEAYATGGSSIFEVLVLSDPHVQNELDLEIADSLWITEFVKRHEKGVRKLEQQAAEISKLSYALSLVERTYSFDEDVAKQYLLYRNFREAELKKIEDHFPADTMKRFKQLRVRHRFVYGGILAAFYLDDSLRDQVGIGFGDLRRLEHRLPQIRAELDQRTHDIYKRLIKATEEVLTERQVRKLVAFIGESPNHGIPVIEHLLWQCRYCQERRPEYHFELDEIQATARFSVRPCGQLAPARHSSPNYGLVMDAIFGLKDHPVDPVQLKAFQNELARRVSHLGDTSSIIDDFRHGLIDYETMWKKRRKIHLEFGAQLLPALRKTLTPIQLEELLRPMRHRALLQRGLLPSLTNGQLGQELDVTEEQKKKLREIAGKFVPELKELSIELEAFVWKEIQGELTPEQQKRLKRLIGSSPSKMAGSPTLLVMTNGREEYADHLISLRADIDRMLQRFGIEQGGEVERDEQ